MRRCHAVRAASAIPPYTLSESDTARAMEAYNASMRRALASPSSHVGAATLDCLYPAFDHSLYYTDDLRERMELWQRMARVVAPYLACHDCLPAREPWDGLRRLRIGVVSSKMFAV